MNSGPSPGMIARIFLPKLGDGVKRELFCAELDQIDAAEDELLGDVGHAVGLHVAGIDDGVEAGAARRWRRWSRVVMPITLTAVIRACRGIS